MACSARFFVLAAFALSGFLVGACSTHRSDAGSASEMNGTEGQFQPDLASPRFCNVTAYQSAGEPTKFAVGDYAISSVSVTTPSAIPLSKFVRTDETGQITEARFGVYFRRTATQSANLLTPYSPLPLLSRDATSLVFGTPPDTAGGDRSTFKVSAPGGLAVVVFDFDETVHGHPGRTMTIACRAADDVGDAGASGGS
jgi:hypothetical protein